MEKIWCFCPTGPHHNYLLLLTDLTICSSVAIEGNSRIDFIFIFLLYNLLILNI